jgi:uncharacterized protein YraI
MKHKVLSLLIIGVLLATSLGMVGAASAQAATGTVNTGALNIRTGPGINYSVITFVYRNTTLSLLARNADSSWVKVNSATGVQGWVSAPYILTAYPISSLPLEYGTGGAYTGSVTSYGLNMRTGPGIGYARVTALSRGTGFTLLARDAASTWVKIQLYDGRQGWVHSGYFAANVAISALPVEGVPQPVPPTPPTGYRTHVVQAGENLFRIGLRYGVNMYDIARLNGITNLALIYAGQVLLIP